MIPIFQRVTPDKYRLVLAEADSIHELAEKLGLSESAVNHGIHGAERGRKSVYQVVWIDESEDE